MKLILNMLHNWIKFEKEKKEKKKSKVLKFMNKPQLLQTCIDGYMMAYAHPIQLVVELTSTKAIVNIPFCVHSLQLIILSDPAKNLMICEI